MNVEPITEGPLLVDVAEGVATLTINDPPYNRMTLGFMDSLENVVERIDHDAGVRAVVFTGAGDHNFSVGMNLKELGPGIEEKGGLDELLDQRLRVLARIEQLDKPCVATLFGNCLGGGLELSLACHFRLVADEGAQIGLPELDLGTLPAWGGTPRLTRCVGRDHALDMILRAKKISGHEALRIGLVTEVWPLSELKPRARDLATELAAMPRVAVAGAMRTIIGAEDMDLAESLSEERRAVHATLESPDLMEGMNAFVEKRKPLFGRHES